MRLQGAGGWVGPGAWGEEAQRAGGWAGGVQAKGVGSWAWGEDEEATGLSAHALKAVF